MSWRFFRRIPITSLVRVNVSKRGASVSLGPPGATVTVGSRGVRGTLGIPGTGLSASRTITFDAGSTDDRLLRLLEQTKTHLVDKADPAVEDYARVLLWQEHYQISDDELSPEMRARHENWRAHPDVQRALTELRFLSRAETAALTPPPAPPRPTPPVFRVLWIALLALAALGLLAAWVNAR